MEHFGKRTWFQPVAQTKPDPLFKPNGRLGEARRNRCACFTRGRSLVRSHVRPLPHELRGSEWNGDAPFGNEYGNDQVTTGAR